MATPVPHPIARLGALAAGLTFWAATALYVIVFSAVSLRQYQAYVPHALDLGNMAQAFWNTVHGHPFRFQNMRAHVAIEAFGTDTRLSFHVEPIIPFLSIIYYFYQHVETLLVLQTVAVASGAIPARLLARRHLEHPLAEVAFPLAYLLFPALEAANLYEFHPVTVAAPLLLWAFYFADGRRYTLFALCAFAAMGAKEEIGVLVAMIGIWIALRNGDRQFGAIVAVLGACWSFIALKEVIPHFHAGDSSYWARYLPIGYPVARYPVTPGDVASYWLHHPKDVLSDLVSEAKLSYLHRIFYPTGYMALLSPITLLAALPSLLLNVLSQEIHMYGGVAHYSAELAPVMVVASILGTEWLCRVISTPKVRGIRIPYVGAVAVCSLYVLAAALLNHRVNGFSPLATQYYYPPITAHDRLLDRVLAMIPPDASVSAQDDLNAHLSDRAYIFLYPDLDKGRVQYIALDATQPTGSVIRPCDLTVQVTGDDTACDVVAGPWAPRPVPYTPAGRIDKTALLQNGKWNVVFAQDGVLLLKRRQAGEPRNTTLPPAFYSFAVPPPKEVPSTAPIAQFGDYLQLLGYHVDRRERANLRNPDIVLTSWWKVTKPLPPRSRIMNYVTDSTGALQGEYDDQPSTDWIALSRWQPGQIYRVDSYQMTVITNRSGWIDVDLGLTTNDRTYLDTSHNLPVRLLRPTGITEVVGSGNILKVTHIAANL